MKRRTTPKLKRDREMETVKAMTTVMMSERDMANRIRADVEALESVLKVQFSFRTALETHVRMQEIRSHEPFTFGDWCGNEASHRARIQACIKDVTARLREVKKQLKKKEK